jgi:tetratricopeptide (TPR) repeat protein
MKRFTLFLFISLFYNLWLFSQDQNDLSLFQLAQQYERSGEIEQAEKIYQKLYEKNPDYFEFYDSYRKILEYSKKYGDATKIILKWLEKRPSDFNQIVNLAIIKFRLGEENLAREKIQEAIKIANNNINVYRVIAASLLEARYYDEALKIYYQARSIDKNAFIIEIAYILVFREKYEDAMLEYLKLLDNNSNNNNQFGYLQSLLMNHINNKNFLDIAINVTKNKLSENRNNLSYYYLLSWLYNEQKNYKDSFEMYLEIERRKKSNGYEIFNFAENAYRDKSYDIAFKAYQYIIDNFKNSGVYLLARLGYARVSEELVNTLFNDSLDNNKLHTEIISQYSRIIKIYEDFLKEFPNNQYSSEVEYRIGDIFLKRFDDLDKASTYFNNVLKKYYLQNYSVNSLIKLAEIAFQKNNLNETYSKYNEILNHQNASNDQKEYAKFKIAELLYFEGKYDSSIKVLNEITNNLSSDYTNDALILINFIQNNQSNKLLTVFSEAEKYESQKKLPEALELFKSIVESGNSSLSEDAFFKIISIQRKLKLFTEALKTANKFINNYPESPLIDKMLFQCAQIYYKDLNDIKNALTYYEKILVEYPNSIYINEVRKIVREIKGDINF